MPSRWAPGATLVALLTSLSVFVFAGAPPAAAQSAPLPRLAHTATAEPHPVTTGALPSPLREGVRPDPGTAELPPPLRRTPRKDAPAGPLTTGSSRADSPRAERETLGTLRQFDGFAESEARRLPPDPSVAVGPNDIVQTVNASWKAFSKTGAVTRGAVTFRAWFADLSPALDGFFNPRAMYRDGHYYIVVAYLDMAAERSFLAVSVSQSSNPNGSWCNYALNGVMGATRDEFAYADFPGVGLTAGALVIGTDHYRFSDGEFTGAMMTVVPRGDLERCGAATVRQFTGFVNEDGGRAIGLQPALDWDSSGPIYAVNSRSPFASWANSVSVWRLDHALTDSTWDRFTVGTQGYSNPPDAPQPNTGTRIPTGNAAMLGAQKRNNVLWAVHGSAVNPGCGSAWQSGVHWLALNAPATGAPSLQQDGLLYGACGEAYFAPNLGVDGAGNLAVAFNRSSSSVAVQVRYAGRHTSDPPGTLQPSELLIQSGAYTETRYWWGNFAGVHVDTADPGTLWITGPYLRGTNSWGTRIGQVSVTGTAAAPPAAPANLRLGTVTDSSIQVRWDDQSSTETAFEVQHTPAGSTSWSTVSVGAGATSWTHTGLTAGRSYQYRVRACNSAGCSAYTATLTGTTTGGAPPATPANVRPGTVTDTSIQIRWDDASSDETAFEIAWTAASPIGYSIVSLAAGTQLWTHTGVTAGKAYYYHVRACRGATCSAWTGALTVTAGSPPATPVNARLGTVTNSSIQVLWNDVAGNETAYHVTWSRSEPISWQTVALPAGATSWQHTGLGPGETYYYFVRSCRGEACSAYTPGVVGTTGGVNPPALPENLRAGNTTATSIQILWDDASGDETGFEVAWTPVSAQTWSTVRLGANTTSWTHSGLSAGSSYYYAVRSCKGGVCSAYTGAIAAGTSGARPPVTDSAAPVPRPPLPAPPP